jgi:hypothetical protein
MVTENWQVIYDEVDGKHRELLNFMKELEIKIKVLSWISNISKVLIIVLGAFSATQGVLYRIYGDDAVGVVLAYSLVGLATAAVAGLQTTFKYEERLSSIKQLSAEIFNLNNMLFTEKTKVNALIDEESKVKAIHKLLDGVSNSIEKLSEKTAQNNIAIIKPYVTE